MKSFKINDHIKIINSAEFPYEMKDFFNKHTKNEYIITKIINNEDGQIQQIEVKHIDGELLPQYLLLREIDFCEIKDWDN